MLRRLAASIAAATLLLTGVAALPAHAGSENLAHGTWQDLCVADSPTHVGCVELTANAGTTHYLGISIDTSDPKTTAYVQAFVDGWNSYVYPLAPMVLPLLQSALGSADGLGTSCSDTLAGNSGGFAASVLIVCNSSKYGVPGTTLIGSGGTIGGANKAADDDMLGSQSYIDSGVALCQNNSAACQEAAVFEQLMDALGLGDFTNDSDPGGASACNQPDQGTVGINDWDMYAMYTWYNGAGE